MMNDIIGPAVGAMGAEGTPVSWGRARGVRVGRCPPHSLYSSRQALPTARWAQGSGEFSSPHWAPLPVTPGRPPICLGLSFPIGKMILSPVAAPTLLDSWSWMVAESQSGEARAAGTP